MYDNIEARKEERKLLGVEKDRSRHVELGVMTGLGLVARYGSMRRETGRAVLPLLRVGMEGAKCRSKVASFQPELLRAYKQQSHAHSTTREDKTKGTGRHQPRGSQDPREQNIYSP